MHVIFDLDGTLLDTLEDLAAAANRTCRLHGWPEHGREAYRHFVGHGMAHLVRCFVPPEHRTPEEVARVLEEFVPWYDAHRADRTVPCPGVPDLLAHLGEAGVQMAVLSNKAHPVTVSLMDSFFPGAFAAVLGATGTLPLKPDPAPVRALLAQLGACPADTVLVGDSEVDVETARNAGLPVCAVTWGFRTREELATLHPDALADTARELGDLLLAFPEGWAGRSGEGGA